MDQPEKLYINSVHLWIVPLDRQTFRGDSIACLSTEELNKLSRFQREKDRIQYALSHIALRSILSSYCSLPPSEIEFEYNRHHKPFIKNGCAFNLSHSEDLAVCAVGKDLLGVDVEWIHPLKETERIVEQFFSAAERRQFFAFPRFARIEAFYRLWTVKEAYLKAIGKGLSSPLDEFDVSLRSDGTVSIDQICGSKEAACLWDAKQIPFEYNGMNYQIAVVAHGKIELKSRVCYP